MIRVKRRSILRRPRRIQAAQQPIVLSFRVTMSRDALKLVLLPGLITSLISSSLAMDVEGMKAMVEGESLVFRKFKRKHRKLSKMLECMKLILSACISFLMAECEDETKCLMLISGPSLRRPNQIVTIRLANEQPISMSPPLLPTPASQLKKIQRGLIQVGESLASSKKMFVILLQPASSPSPHVPEGCILIPRHQQIEKLSSTNVMQRSRGRDPRKIDIILLHTDPFDESALCPKHSKDVGPNIPPSSSAFQINRPIKRI